MVKRIGGSRRKTRNIFKKDVREKGKVSLGRFFKKLEQGDKVLLKAEPSYHKGMYHSRFHSKTGKIKGKKGDCYEVEIKDSGKKKTLTVHPVHLKRL